MSMWPPTAGKIPPAGSAAVTRNSVIGKVRIDVVGDGHAAIRVAKSLDDIPVDDSFHVKQHNV